MRSARQKSQTPENKKTDRFKMPCLLSKAAPGLAKPVAGGAPAISSLTKKGPALHAPGPLNSKNFAGEAVSFPVSLTLRKSAHFGKIDDSIVHAVHHIGKQDGANGTDSFHDLLVAEPRLTEGLDVLSRHGTAG